MAVRILLPGGTWVVHDTIAGVDNALWLDAAKTQRSGAIPYRPSGSAYRVESAYGGTLLDGCPVNVVLGQGAVAGQAEALSDLGITCALLTRPAVLPGAVSPTGACCPQPGTGVAFTPVSTLAPGANIAAPSNPLGPGVGGGAGTGAGENAGQLFGGMSNLLTHWIDKMPASLQEPLRKLPPAFQGPLGILLLVCVVLWALMHKKRGS